jgi:1,4-dihydroxy-2-naphthoate polyprenyltransferase
METISSKSFVFDRSTLLHLRVPFSFFLLPVFLFSLSQAVPVNWFNTFIMFVVLHFFIYPASNVYNSYMDNDKGSIGGLKNPPPVTRKLYTASIYLDCAGLLLCLLIGFKMVLLMLVYIGISKAYSWRKIRLKKYGITGWLVVMLFQGGYTFLLVKMAAENNFDISWFDNKNILAMLLASLLIGGFYPLTQIYQHEEDAKRGDLTISYLLGIKGTFAFTALIFFAACVVGWFYFTRYSESTHFFIFLVSLIPVVSYFLYWANNSFRNPIQANYTFSMRMAFLSSACMMGCFIILSFLNLG